MKPDKKSFYSGFAAGYALGQYHAGEGAYRLTPLNKDDAWKEFQQPKKKFLNKIIPIDEDDDVEIGDEEIPY